MGVSGSGKTTIGKKLAARIGLPFFDGDDFHPPSNKEKMTLGIPLTDEDRKEWLTNMNALAKEQMKKEGAVWRLVNPLMIQFWIQKSEKQLSDTITQQLLLMKKDKQS